ITCGNPGAACVGIPGCGAPPDPPVAPCVRNTCCDTPGFVVPTFNVPILGGLCGRVDQVACGVGVVNTSHPQTGDTEVTTVGDMCTHAGAGFSSASPDGPITVGPLPAAAIPYGGGNSIPVAAGPVFSGSAPLFDIGFIAITPNGSPTIVAPESCSCTPVPGCPE